MTTSEISSWELIRPLDDAATKLPHLKLVLDGNVNTALAYPKTNGNVSLLDCRSGNPAQTVESVDALNAALEGIGYPQVPADLVIQLRKSLAAIRLAA